MSRYVGPIGDVDDAILTRASVGSLVSDAIEAALVGFGGGTGGNINPVYVRASSTGLQDGSDFANAYGINVLGTAIANASPGATIHILASDTYTGLANITIPAYATAHLSVGNEVTIQASDINGVFVPIVDPATDYATISEAVTAAQTATATASTPAQRQTAVDDLQAMLDVADTFDYAAGLVLTGTRTPDPRATAEEYRAPIDVSAWTDGSPLFILNGVSHLIFKGIGFKDVGNGCFRHNGINDNIHFVDCAARNVYRYISMNGSGGGPAPKPYEWSNGSDVRADVRGYARDVVQIRNASHDVDIDDPFMVSQYQSGENFPSGIHVFSPNDAYTNGNDGFTDRPNGCENIRIRGVSRIGVIGNVFDGGQPDTEYRNGDSVTAEIRTVSITLQNLLFANNSDGGLDSKATANVLTLDTVIAVGNKRNFRFHYDNASALLGPIYSIRPQRRGGVGGAASVWLSRGATIDELYVLDDAPSGNIVLAEDSSIAAISSGRIVSAFATDPTDATLDPSVEEVAVSSVERVPNFIYNPVAVSPSSTEMGLTWEPADQGYAATFDVEIDDVVSTGFTIASPSTPATTVTGLTADTAYELRVRGKNSTGTAGEWSLLMTASTLAADVSSFVDTTFTDLSVYDWLAAIKIANPAWSLQGDGFLWSPQGSDASRMASPNVGLTVDHSLETVFEAYDNTSQVTVMARVTAHNKGVGFRYRHTQRELRLLNNNVSVRTLVIPADLPPPLTLKIEAVGDAFRCWSNGSLVDWTGAGETSVTLTGHTSHRVGVNCADNDTAVSRISAASV